MNNYKIFNTDINMKTFYKFMLISWQIIGVIAVDKHIKMLVNMRTTVFCLYKCELVGVKVSCYQLRCTVGEQDETRVTA